jgi:hypothetical protein
MSTNAAHYHTVSELNTMKQEIKHIKAYFSPKHEMMKWTVGVGISALLAITGMVSVLFLNLDAKITDLRKEIKAEHRELRQEIHQAVNQAIVVLSEKIDRVAKK